MKNRRISDLIPELQEKYKLFRKAMSAAGLDFIVTETRRSQERQNKLWAQGRTKPGRIVTWTRNSKHIEGKAFDFAMRVNGKITWDAKYYKRAGEIGTSLGMKWSGHRRSNPYMTHFEI